MRAKSRNRIALVAVLALPVLVMLTLNGCSGSNPAELPVATAPVDPIVYRDGFGATLDFFAWGSFYEALSEESAGGYDDTRTLKITIPGHEWTGGSFYTRAPRDLSSYNALTFYTKASQRFDLPSCGFGITLDAPETYKTEIQGTPLTGTWSKVVIPIPDPDKLTSETGMFWFSSGGEEWPIEIWFDEVIFANVENLTNPRPVMNDQAVEVTPDETIAIEGTKTTFNLNGEDVEVFHTSAYFTYISSDTTVAKVQDGVITAGSGGTATITAKLRDTDVEGQVTVTVIGPPAMPAPTPTPDEADVISIFSDAYTNNITVDSWLADTSSEGTDVSDEQVQGDNVKAYTGLLNWNHADIDFAGDQIDADAADMTHFHMDVFAPVGSMFRIKLVDFGPDGVLGGGDDTEKQLPFHGGSTPPFAAGEWVSLDIPLTEFTDMNFGNLAQISIDSINVGSVWIDNIYFHQ